MRRSFQTAELLLSASHHEHYPTDDVPEIVLSGRSNVGKSSFINTLLHRKKLAYISNKPGKTRLLNFYNVDDQLRFIDSPGYGYAKVSRTERTKWDRVFKDYITSRKNLKLVITLVDFRHKPTVEDINRYELLKHCKVPLLLIATKSDKVPKGKWHKNESMIKKRLNFDPKDAFIVFSSVRQQGVEKSWEYIFQFVHLS